MDDAERFDFSKTPDLPEIKDQETLAAISEGIEDAKAGRVFSIEEVRRHLAEWTTASSTRSGR